MSKDGKVFILDSKVFRDFSEVHPFVAELSCFLEAHFCTNGVKKSNIL